MDIGKFEQGWLFMLRQVFWGIVLSFGLFVGPMAKPSFSQVSAPVTAFSEALKMPDVIAVLREEGLKNGDELAADLPGGAGDPGWKAKVSQIYDTDRMYQQFSSAFEDALGDDRSAIEVATAFFASDLGQRIMTLETDARRTLLGPDIELAAKLSFSRLAKENPARQALLEEFVVANDLIESNVMGTLNSNIAFFRGLAQVGDAQLAMPESDMLAEVWSGEAQARADTVDWLFPFLALAYQPLTDEELRAYITFSKTPAGRKANAAMFVAFDVVFDDISRALGQAVGQQMAGQDI